VSLLAANFSSGAGAFAYVDDGFRGSVQPGYAAGTYDAAGGYMGGGVRVNLGGVNDLTIVGMSGRWLATFNTPTSGPVTVQLRYRLRLEGTYEAEECGEALVAVDGALRGAAVGQDYLERYCGATPQNDVVRDSGWRQISLPLTLAAGSHTLALGGYNNQKTRANETMAVYFDDIDVTAPQ
jgi:hypothetical protein